MTTVKESNQPLSIRLTESVVFLRHSLDTRRQHVDQQPPAMLRGLLIMHLTKPTRISSIEIALEGKSVVHFPEAGRIADLSEENLFLSARTVLYDAKTHSSSKRSASLELSSHTPDRDLEYVDDEANLRAPASSTRPNFLSLFDQSSLMPPSHSTPSNLRPNSTERYQWQHNSPIEQLTQTISPDQFATPPVSPPYTPLQNVSELPAISRPVTPVGNPGERSHRSSRSFRGDHPGQMLEDFRNALRMEIGGPSRSIASGTPPTSPPVTSEVNAAFSSRSTQTGFTVTSPPESPMVSRSTSDDIERSSPRPALLQPGSLRSTRNVSPSPSPSLLPSNDLPLEHETDISRGRHSSPRWSLSNMTNVFKDAKDKLRGGSKDKELRRGRNPEPRPHEQHHTDFVLTEDSNHKLRDHRKTTLAKLTSAVRLDEPSHVENWKEFRKGTYTYPVSFAIPSSYPPTIHCDYGTITYRLRGVVHRPGTLTSKLAASRDVILVASPPDDDAEETPFLNVERQWDTQLRYLIAFSGRSFTIGSRIPFKLTLVPMEKVKIYRISIYLEERAEYHINKGAATREQLIKRFELLSIKHPDRIPKPILPINPNHGSLLTPYLETSSTGTSDEALASLMGPGPWVLTQNLELPSECGKIHFTYKHRNAAITVNHSLKIAFRAERGDDQAIDSKTSKRRLFDIVVQTPILILSCHSSPDWTSLPRYSSYDEGENDLSFRRTCGCSTGLTSQPLSSRNNSSPVVTPFTSRPATPERSSNTHPTFGTSSTSELSEFARSSHHFARLMAGEEGVVGDSPPQYGDVSF
ncbi:hypothetical protein BU17DRAFT_89281 [Hysterangium stoloniferum]|nr:hypothetical protein BU17DRAFT_89281 [Hysterangium stoloniferum]